MNDRAEFDEKRERLSRLCHDAGLAGVLIATQANFSWLTGGRTNRIDSSRELGAGALLVGRDGRGYIVANTIEMPRLAGEELSHLSLTPVEYPWVDDHASADAPLRLARQVLGADARVGADWSLAGATPVERDVAHVRAPLTAAEVERYRAFGQDVARALETMCRALEPGVDEHEIARRVRSVTAAVGGHAVVVLVGADERIARFRHPVPTAARWKKTVLVASCVQRYGLIVAASRIVNVGAVDADLAHRTRATASVFAALLDATRSGATGAEIFAAAAAAYTHAGFPGEERKHHQGGAAGYRSRDWVAHPASEERVRPPQAFAWNPSITGTKVEDTAVVSEAGLELITSTGEWPGIPITVGERSFAVADILSI
jgi:Xaa-Pro dipeptidase